VLRAGPNVIAVTVADGWWAVRIGITGSNTQGALLAFSSWPLVAFSALRGD
jgi:hypothetical protein